MASSMEFNEFMGLRFVEKLDDGGILELSLRPEHLNYDGVVHGGATAALVDAALGMTIKHHRPGATFTTTELKVNYLRPAQEGVLRARATFKRNGRKLVVGTVDVADPEGRLVATALLTYMILREDGAALP